MCVRRSLPLWWWWSIDEGVFRSRSVLSLFGNAESLLSSSCSTRSPTLSSPVLTLQQRNVELGRVALVNLKADKLYGKLVVIVDLVDQNRVLVDAPGIKRCIINLKRLAITPIKLDTGRCPDAAALEAAHKGAVAEFAASKWGKKIAKQGARKALNDFDRFKVAIARSKRSAIVKKAMA